MSQRMTMDEVLKEYGVPQLRLDVHATRSDLLKLREKLMAIRDLSDGREQASSTPSARSTPSPRTSSPIRSKASSRARQGICVFQFGYEYRGYPRIERI